MSRKDVFSQAAKVYFTAGNVSKFVPNSNVTVSNTLKEYLMSTDLTVYDGSKPADKNFFRRIVTARNASELSDNGNK